MNGLPRNITLNSLSGVLATIPGKPQLPRHVLSDPGADRSIPWGSTHLYPKKLKMKAEDETLDPLSILINCPQGEYVVSGKACIQRIDLKSGDTGAPAQD